MDNSRLFVAIPLPENLKAIFRDFFVAHPFLKWTNSANIHLTLRFIGNVPNENVANIRNALRKTKFETFPLSVTGIGIFQRKDSAVIWAGIGKEPALIRLKEEVDRVLWEKAEIVSKESRYVPHLTLARIRGKTALNLKDFLSAHKKHDFGMIKVNSFCLYQSFLEQSGARHEIIESYNPLEKP